MAYYQKEIIYLSYKEKGEKVKNAGFVRVQRYETAVKLDMQITGLSGSINQKADVLLKLADEREVRLGEIEIQRGQGSWEKQVDSTKPFTIWVDLAGEKQIIGSSSLGTGKNALESAARVGRGSTAGSTTGSTIGSTAGYPMGSFVDNTSLGAAENKADSYLRNGVERLLGEFVGRSREESAGKTQADTAVKASAESAGKAQQDPVGRFLEKSMGKFADFAVKRPAEQKNWEQKAAEQRSAEQKAAEHIATEQKAAEQKAAEQKSAEQRSAEQRSAKQSAAEQKPVEQIISDYGTAREAAEYAGGKGIGAAGKIESIRPGKGYETEQVSSDASAEKRFNGARVNLSGSEKPLTEQEIILNDKWKQLMQLYPVIHPYEDDREYLSIQPKDFVVMTGDHQHLANNSFLLHGYYNYRHVILGKEKLNGEEQFFLGVPGVYYEREKMVALMFGFEAFECNGGRAEAGKFGYYLRKVTI